MFRRILTLVAIAALAACAAIDLKRPLAPGDIARFHRVAVVSLLADNAQFIAVGPTVLNDRRYTAPVPDWGVDAQAEARLLALLRAQAGIAAAVLDHPRDTVAQLRAEHAQRVWDLARAQGFDTVVSVWPSLSENFPLFRPGYGYIDRNLLGRDHQCLYAAFTVEVYDVATRRRIAWEWGGDAPCDLEAVMDLPVRARFEDYSAAERQQMRAGVLERIATGLDYAIARLGFAPPAGRAR